VQVLWSVKSARVQVRSVCGRSTHRKVLERGVGAVRQHHELQLARELEECKRQRHGGLWWWEGGTTAAAQARARGAPGEHGPLAERHALRKRERLDSERPAPRPRCVSGRLCRGAERCLRLWSGGGARAQLDSDCRSGLRRGVVLAAMRGSDRTLPLRASWARDAPRTRPWRLGVTATSAPHAVRAARCAPLCALPRCFVNRHARKT
jgi:hypothetical protein